MVDTVGCPVDVPVDDVVDNGGRTGDNRPLAVECPVDLRIQRKYCRKPLVGLAVPALESVHVTTT
jgi:hypothetical protein